MGCFEGSLGGVIEHCIYGKYVLFDGDDMICFEAARPWTVEHAGMSVEAVRSVLEDAGRLYPDFDEWFVSKVVPGLGDTRSVFGHTIGNEIAGVVIAKRTAVEQKLCTIWVDPKHRGLGVANDLVGRAIEWLGNHQPLLTIPSTCLEGFRSLLSDRGFLETQRLDCYYRTGVTEHVFNGRIILPS